jgi:homoserine dehydrogenase
MPTASAVVADMIDMAVGRTAITFKTLELWSDAAPRVNVDRPGNLEGKFYVRMNVQDRPGVLAKIAGVLGDHKVSIAAVHQHDSEGEHDSTVPVVIVTQSAPESDAKNAVDQIARLPIVASIPERLRILE